MPSPVDPAKPLFAAPIQSGLRYKDDPYRQVLQLTQVAVSTLPITERTVHARHESH